MSDKTISEDDDYATPFAEFCFDTNSDVKLIEADEDIIEGNLRKIVTARDEQAINEAAKNGFFPLMKKLEPSEALRTKFAVKQNIKTGQITVVSDYRDRGYSRSNEGGFETVIPFTFYYSYAFPSPFAAYLIPKDIKIGERVLLIDLIEDYVGSTWNQGDTFRLESCEAIWNGIDFDIQYNPDINRRDFIG
jgi:hypothetical protein